MKVNVFHVEGALPYVLSAHETTTIHFWEKRVWSLQAQIQIMYLQPIITQYFIDNKSEIWLLFLIAHSKR